MATVLQLLTDARLNTVAEHNGWEGSMTVVGHVAEPGLTELIEGRVLSLPKHEFVHPDFGTKM